MTGKSPAVGLGGGSVDETIAVGAAVEGATAPSTVGAAGEGAIASTTSTELGTTMAGAATSPGIARTVSTGILLASIHDNGANEVPNDVPRGMVSPHAANCVVKGSIQTRFERLYHSRRM